MVNITYLFQDCSQCLFAYQACVQKTPFIIFAFLHISICIYVIGLLKTIVHTIEYYIWIFKIVLLTIQIEVT